MSAEERAVPWGQKIYLLFTSLIPPVVLILAVLGSIFFGIASPTEAAGVGALASVVMAAGYRSLSFRVIKETAYKTNGHLQHGLCHSRWCFLSSQVSSSGWAVAMLLRA